MATPEEVAALRLLIAEPDESRYSDTQLQAALDAAQGDQDLVAYQIWTQKAAAASGLVDVSEGGSSRKLGDLAEQALKMAEVFAGRAQSSTTPPDGVGSVRIRRITRP